MIENLLKKMLGALLAALIVLPQAGVAAAIDFDSGADANSVVGTLRSASSAAAPGLEGAPVARPMVDWTLMYFVNGKNNLGRFLQADVRGMERVGSSNRVKVVVELGLLGTSAKRYLIQRSTATGASLASPVVQDLGRVDMGDWRHLAEFGNWVKANYPARHYMLTISNHGSGWLQRQAEGANLRGRGAGQAAPQEEREEGAQDDDGEKGISADDETHHHISTTDLGRALAAMGGVDVYSSDACLMQMAEVGYQLRNHAGVILGSQELAPGPGMNYAAFLNGVMREPTMSPTQVGHTYVDAWRRTYARSDNTQA